MYSGYFCVINFYLNGNILVWQICKKLEIGRGQIHFHNTVCLPIHAVIKLAHWFLNFLSVTNNKKQSKLNFSKDSYNSSSQTFKTQNSFILV